MSDLLFAEALSLRKSAVRPVYTNEIPIFVKMTLEHAMKGTLNRFADPAREMDIRGGDDDPI